MQKQIEEAAEAVRFLLRDKLGVSLDPDKIHFTWINVKDATTKEQYLAHLREYLKSGGNIIFFRTKTDQQLKKVQSVSERLCVEDGLIELAGIRPASFQLTTLIKPTGLIVDSIGQVRPTIASKLL